MATDAQASSKKFLGLKIGLGLLPAFVLNQCYAWMTLNKLIGISFLLMWALVVWSAWKLNEKNQIIVRHLRLAEIGFFLLPVAAIVMSFSFGAHALDASSGGAEQAGAAVGAAIGGFFAVALGFVIGLSCGTIMHLLANNYTKKLGSEKPVDTFNNKHGIAAVLGGLFLMAIILPNMANGSPKTTDSEKDSGSPQAEATVPAEPSPIEVSSITITQNIIDEPEVNVKLKNLTDKKIIAYKVRLNIFNKFDEPVSNTFSFDDSNEFLGISQDEIAAKSTRTMTWQLTGYDTAGKATAEIYHVKFEDGTEWKSANEN